MIWLVASKTTQPVVNEITESIATSRRLLVFQFPSEHRDQSTQELLETVSTYSKWHNLDSPTALSQALKASIFDELIKAVRDPAPPARHTRLREWLALSIATCKQSWITLGVPSELANELANDRSIGDVLAAPHANLQVVIGDVGSGKSLAASRLFQHAIDNALQDATKPFPVFVNARDLQHEPITEYIKRQTDGFVQPFHQRTLIIIDGLDEKGVLQANECQGRSKIRPRWRRKTSRLLKNSAKWDRQIDPVVLRCSQH